MWGDHIILKILGLGKFLEDLGQHENSRRRSHRCSPHGIYSRSRRRRDFAAVDFRTRPNTWRNDRPNGWPWTCRCGYHLGLCDRLGCRRDLERFDRTRYHYYGQRPRHQMSPPRRHQNHTSPWARHSDPHANRFPAPRDEDLERYPDNSSSDTSMGNLSVTSVDTGLTHDYEDDRGPRRHAENSPPRGYLALDRRSRQSRNRFDQYGLRRGSSDTEEGLRFGSSLSGSEISSPSRAPTESFGSEDSW